MDLSIVIPTHNRSRLLERTLQGLSDQDTTNPIREVLIVSDGSTDETRFVAENFRDRLPIRFIEQDKASVSAARNLGLSHAIGSIILLLDDDVVPSPSLVSEHIKFHYQNPAVESVLLGYVTWLPELPITPFMQWYGEYGALFGYGFLEDGKQVDRKYLYSCNISFKTSFIRSVSGFNEQLSVYEDHELGYRLAQRGMKMFFARHALGYHNQTFTFRQACERMHRYSRGVPSFLATEAGKEMTASQSAWKRKLKTLSHPLARLLKPLTPLADSSLRLPRALYRILYWYGAIQPINKASE